ncbi:hypothetical protein [Colwellia sp. E150_009]
MASRHCNINFVKILSLVLVLSSFIFSTLTFAYASSILGNWESSVEKDIHSTKNPHFQFSVTEAKTVLFEISSNFTSNTYQQGLYVYLLNSDGEVLKEKQGSKSFLSLSHQLDIGSYTLVVSTIKSYGIGSFTITTYDLSSPMTAKIASTTEGGWALPVRAVAKDVHSINNPHYPFNLNEAKNITFDISGNFTSGAYQQSFYLYLLDSQGLVINELQGTDMSSSSSSPVRFSADLQAGDYTLVLSVTKDSGSIGSFTITTYDLSSPMTPKTTSTLDGEWDKTTGNNITFGYNPRYKLEVYKNGIVDIQMDSTGIIHNGYLYLINQNGGIVAEGGGSSNITRIQASVQAGMYNVVASTTSHNENGNFTLSTYGGMLSGLTPETYQGSWISSGGKSYQDKGNKPVTLTIEEAGRYEILINSDNNSEPYLYLLNEQGEIIPATPSTGQNYGSIKLDLVPGKYIVVAATTSAGISDNFTLSVINAKFSEFIPLPVTYSVPVNTGKYQTETITLNIPSELLAGEKQNLAFSYTVNGVKTTVDLAQYQCSQGQSCTITVDTSAVAPASAIDWQLTGDAFIDGAWQNQVLMEEVSLHKLNVITLNPLKQDTFYAPINIQIGQASIVEKYENFRLEYQHKAYSQGSVQNSILIPVEELSNFTFDVDLTDLKPRSPYIVDKEDDTGPVLHAKLIADRIGGAKDVELSSQSQFYTIRPEFKLSETFASDGIVRFKALLPSLHKTPKIEVTSTTRGSVIKYPYPDSYTPGPEYVDYEIYIGNAGSVQITPVQVSPWGIAQFSIIKEAEPPELTITPLNRKGIMHNGIYAQAKWGTNKNPTISPIKPMDYYCPQRCDVKLHYRYITNTQTFDWQTYSLNNNFETASRDPSSDFSTYASGFSEGLWFDINETGAIEAKLVASYTWEGSDFTQTIAETSVDVEPRQIETPVDKLLQDANVNKWEYKLDWRNSTDTNWVIDMRWPEVLNANFKIEHEVNGVWEGLTKLEHEVGGVWQEASQLECDTIYICVEVPICTGTDNACRITLENADVSEKFKLTTVTGGDTTFEELTILLGGNSFTAHPVTTSSSKAFKGDFQYDLNGENDYVRYFYTEDETLFDQPIVDGWQELSIDQSAFDDINTINTLRLFSFIKHSEGVDAAAVRLLLCRNDIGCYSPPKTYQIKLPLGPQMYFVDAPDKSMKTPDWFKIWVKPYTDESYKYRLTADSYYTDYLHLIEKTDSDSFVWSVSGVFDATNGDHLRLTSEAHRLSSSAGFGRKSDDYVPISYLAGEIVAPELVFTAPPPGCPSGEMNCGYRYVNPMNPGTINATISHPKGIKKARLILYSDTITREIGLGITQSSATEASLSFDLAELGHTLYNYRIIASSNSGTTVQSAYYTMRADNDLIAAPNNLTIVDNNDGTATATWQDLTGSPQFNRYRIYYNQNTQAYINDRSQYTFTLPTTKSINFGVAVCYLIKDSVSNQEVEKCSHFTSDVYEKKSILSIKTDLLGTVAPPSGQ